jgi:hypothetical protein
MPLQLVDRFHPRLAAQQQAEIDAGKLRKREELELLSPQQLRPLGFLSLLMFIGGGLFFAILNIVAYIWQTHRLPGALTGGSLLLWLLSNIASSIVIVVIHEAIHGAAFALWGGKPHFGARLPYALYCGARNQLFRRNYYLVIGLAPLVLITLAGIVCTLLFPVASPYVILAWVGNFSGAAGDAWVVARLLRQPAHVFVEDTETGCRVWEIGQTDPALTA